MVAFVGLFSTVGFQMPPQMECFRGCIRGCIITQVAFVWLFSTVHFHMSPQIKLIAEIRTTSLWDENHSQDVA